METSEALRLFAKLVPAVIASDCKERGNPVNCHCPGLLGATLRNDKVLEFSNYGNFEKLHYKYSLRTKTSKSKVIK